MQTLIKFIKDGWSDHKDNFPSAIQLLWSYREELTVIEGVVFKSEKVFIRPPSLRKCVLEKFHPGHMGIERNLY